MSVTCQFSLGTPVSSINKTDCQDIAEILLKVVLNTITLTLTTRDHFINVSIPWYPLCHYLMPLSYHYMIPSMSLSHATLLSLHDTLYVTISCHPPIITWYPLCHYLMPLSYHYMIPSMSLFHATLLSLHDTLYVTLLLLHDTLYVTISCHPPIITNLLV